MQLPRPYFFTSEHVAGYVDRPEMAPRKGPVMDKVEGYHTLWVAEVPFISTFKSEAYKDFDFASANRLDFLLKRQKRFLSDLAFLREYQTTFEMRLVSWPQNHGPTRIGLAFLGKVFHKDEQTSRNLAISLWDKFSALFPKEAPFSYPLLPVQLENNKAYPQAHTFSQWYQPLSFEQLANPASIVELRKYEDWPASEIVMNMHECDYIPHPFEPALDYSALARLFETLASQRDICVVSVVLRPQRLTNREIVVLHNLLGWHQQIAREGASLNTQFTGILGVLNRDVLSVYQQTRAKLGIQVYERLIHEQHCLFTMRLQVIGSLAAQQDLVEALGSEVVANVSNDYPGLWSRITPATQQEFDQARYNAQWLEFVRWGTSPLVKQFPDLTRLRQLVSVDEAMGAFRLPIAPTGGLAGIGVRDEPFPLPTDMREHKSGFVIGTLSDRGMQTDLLFSLPLESLCGFILLLGDNSKSRKAVLRSLLQGACTESVPWVLICNADPEITDLVNGLSVHHVVLDTHASVQWQGIQPFVPPPAISLPTFIDALVRVFVSVCQLELSSSPLLRKALTEFYTQYEADQLSQITSTDLAVGLEKALQHISAPDTLVNVLHTRIIPPLQDLAMTVGTIFTTSPATDGSWTTPVIVEIGRIGNDLSLALLRGWLWAWFCLVLTTREISQGIRGFVAVEEAHTIFGSLPTTFASSVPPVITLAQTVAHAGVSTLLVDNRAHLLSDEISSEMGTVIVTSSSNENAQEKAARLIGLSQRERLRLRRLSGEEAIVMMPGTSPVLINVSGQTG